MQQMGETERLRRELAVMMRLRDEAIARADAAVARSNDLAGFLDEVHALNRSLIQARDAAEEALAAALRAAEAEALERAAQVVDDEDEGPHGQDYQLGDVSDFRARCVKAIRALKQSHERSNDEVANAELRMPSTAIDAAGVGRDAPVPSQDKAPGHPASDALNPAAAAPAAETCRAECASRMPCALPMGHVGPHRDYSPGWTVAPPSDPAAPAAETEKAPAAPAPNLRILCALVTKAWSAAGDEQEDALQAAASMAEAYLAIPAPAQGAEARDGEWIAALNRFWQFCRCDQSTTPTLLEGIDPGCDACAPLRKLLAARAAPQSGEGNT